MIDYSVIIRTTGKELNPQPKEVIVVLPLESDLPENKLGYEKFYFSPKGMVKQRLLGIEKCKTKYGLVCDDDVVFEKQFVQKMYKAISKGNYRISIAPLYSFLPSPGINAIISAMSSSAVPNIFHKQYYNKVLRTTGYSYNRRLQKNAYYETQTAPWTCFFAEIKAIKDIEMEKETWLEKNGYSALDDQTMFYKGWLRGIKTVVVPDARYEHLDARTSTKNNKSSFLYSSVYNRIIYWHRFIYSQQNLIGKFWALSCFIYRLFWILILNAFDSIRGKITYKELMITFRAFFDGYNYLHSEEYKEMDSLISEVS